METKTVAALNRKVCGTTKRLEVWGNNALFTRPEFKTERMTYEVITPSAARGLIESIYWHPGVKYVIDRIYVLNPIRFSNIKRNEVQRRAVKQDFQSEVKTGKPVYLNAAKERTQRSSMILEDVRYVIEFHITIDENEPKSETYEKVSGLLAKRMKHGSCFMQPYLGTREFPAYFREWTDDDIPTINETRDLGLMLYDMNYANKEDIKPMFFMAHMKNGVIPVSGEKVYA